MLPNSGQRCGEAGDRWGQPPPACGPPVDNCVHSLWIFSPSTVCGERPSTNPQAAELV